MSLSSQLLSHRVLSYQQPVLSHGRSGISVTETGKCCNLGLFYFVELVRHIPLDLAISQAYRRRSRVSGRHRVFWSGGCVVVGWVEGTGYISGKIFLQGPCHVKCFSETMRSSLYLNDSHLCVMQMTWEQMSFGAPWRLSW